MAFSSTRGFLRPWRIPSSDRNSLGILEVGSISSCFTIGEKILRERGRAPAGSVRLKRHRAGPTYLACCPRRQAGDQVARRPSPGRPPCSPRPRGAREAYCPQLHFASRVDEAVRPSKATLKNCSRVLLSKGARPRLLAKSGGAAQVGVFSGAAAPTCQRRWSGAGRRLGDRR